MSRITRLLFAAALFASPLAAQRPIPDTSGGIFVWNDQLATWNMTEAQFQFAATHYVGTQKVLRDDARHLRQYNPNFLVSHYRLGQALGHSIPNASCQPTTNYLSIIDGNQWIQEWPGDPNVQENWFFHWNASRVFNCTGGHYLMELNDTGWRSWWSGQIITQLQDNEDDALFGDSYSIPNYFGSCTWNPCLPGVDPTFESQWATREHDFTDYIRGRFARRWRWMPNIGSFITSRDPSDYSRLDGAMIEGFSEWGGGGYFAPSDWVLQMNRILPLVRSNRILIGQTYPNVGDINERLFVLGSYLLIKGRRTFLNMDIGMDPEWFPEYSLVLGPAIDPLPADISGEFDPSWSVYVRHFAHGMVLVNPGTTSQSIALPATFQEVIPSGGGFVPPDGSEPGSLSTAPVTSLTLAANQAAILLSSDPAVDTIQPASGPSSGGTAVTIGGANFQVGLALTIGGQAASGVSVPSGIQITASTPALTPGTLNDVAVTNPGGALGPLIAAFFSDFLDVPGSQPFHAFIEKIFRDGITGGCGGGNFCPPAGVQRSQMAVFLLRGARGPAFSPPPAVGIFADVPASNPFAPWIEELYNEGVTGGCGSNPLTYCPGSAVTRSQMAVFLLRENYELSYTPPSAAGIFADVPASNPFAPWIEELYNEGVTGGCNAAPLLYCPGDPVSRDQMAVFLATMFDLP
jgi:hypothetical protein